jgi:hypothetical protein
MRIRILSRTLGVPCSVVTHAPLGVHSGVAVKLECAPPTTEYSMVMGPKAIHAFEI